MQIMNKPPVEKLFHNHYKINLVELLKQHFSVKDSDPDPYSHLSALYTHPAIAIIESYIKRFDNPNVKLSSGVPYELMHRTPEHPVNEIHMTLDFTGITKLTVSGMYYLVGSLLPALIYIPFTKKEKQVIRRKLSTNNYHYDYSLNDHHPRYKAISLCGISDEDNNALLPIYRCIKLATRSVKIPYTMWVTINGVEEFSIHNVEYITVSQQKLLDEVYTYYENLGEFNRATKTFSAKDIVELKGDVQRTLSGTGSALKRLATDYPSILKVIQIQSGMGTQDQRTRFEYRFPYHISDAPKSDT